MPKNKKFITLERIFKNGLLDFRRNAWLAIAAMAMITITLTILLFSVIANATFNRTINQLTSRIDVSVYLKDSISPQQRDQLINQLKSVDNVKSVTYVSKAQALATFRQSNITNPDVLAEVNDSPNFLPDTLHIKPKDPNKLQSIKDFLDKPEVKNLQALPTSYSGNRKEAIDRIAKAAHFIQKAGVIGIIIFIIISVLIIFNTIRMAIFNRREELGIMRLLGATTWYIRGPFVVEVMIYGVIAALISVGICKALFTLASNTLQASSLGLLDIKYSTAYFASNFWKILTIQLAVGIIIGAVSSVVATRRYLKFRTNT